MIKITKPLLQKALIAGFFSAFTIRVLTVLTYKSTLGYFLAGSFGSSMVLLFGFPESPFAQPKNVFFGHLISAFAGVLVFWILGYSAISLGLGVGLAIFLMMVTDTIHPPAGANPIIAILVAKGMSFIIMPVAIGAFFIVLFAVIYNKLLHRKYFSLEDFRKFRKNKTSW